MPSFMAVMRSNSEPVAPTRARSKVLIGSSPSLIWCSICWKTSVPDETTSVMSSSDIWRLSSAGISPLFAISSNMVDDPIRSPTGLTAPSAASPTSLIDPANSVIRSIIVAAGSPALMNSSVRSCCRALASRDSWPIWPIRYANPPTAIAIWPIGPDATTNATIAPAASFNGPGIAANAATSDRIPSSMVTAIGMIASPRSTSISFASAIAVWNLNAVVSAVILNASSSIPVVSVIEAKIASVPSTLAPIKSITPDSARMLPNTEAAAAELPSNLSDNVFRVASSPFCFNC